MFFLLERRERKRAEALAKQAKADADATEARADAAKARANEANLARIEATETIRKFLESLTDAQKDAIYSGPVIIGSVIWIRVDGKDAIGPRDNANWLIDAFAPPPANKRRPQCCCTP